MAYQGYSFIWDGTPSSLYGLKICSWDSSPTDYNGGSEMDLIEDQAPRSLKRYLLGALPNKPLEFEMAIYSEQPIADYKAQVIKKWLFGHPNKYRKLFIVKESVKDLYYECYLNSPQDKMINGYNGWTFTVHCNAGGAWENERTDRFTPTNGGIITFVNTSGNNDYMYPIVSFKMSSNGSFSITNSSDNGRIFQFTGLLANEVITCNGETGVITSSNNARRFANFNKNYLRFVTGINQLTCSGNIEYIEFTYSNFRRLGGG
jgi:phage-related protein